MNYLAKSLYVFFLVLLTAPVSAFEEGSIADSVNQFGKGVGSLNRSIEDMNQNLKNIREEIAGCGDACTQQRLDRYQRLLYEYDMHRLIMWRTKVALLINKKNMDNETTMYCSDEYMAWYNCYNDIGFLRQQAQAAIGVIPGCKATYEKYVTECRNPVDMFVNGYPAGEADEVQSPYLNYYGQSTTAIDQAVFEKAGGMLEIITPISPNTLRHIKNLFPKGKLYVDYHSLRQYITAHSSGHKILRCLYPQQKELWYWYKSAPDFGPLTDNIKNTHYHPSIIITESRSICPISPSEADFNKNSYHQAAQRSKAYIAKNLKEYKESHKKKSDAIKFFFSHGQKLAEHKEEKLEALLTPRDRVFRKGAGIVYEELNQLVSGEVKYLECRYVRAGTFRYLLSDRILNILTQHKLLGYRFSKTLDKCPDGSKEAESLRVAHANAVSMEARKIWEKNEAEADAAWQKELDLRFNRVVIDEIPFDESIAIEVPFNELNVKYMPSLDYPVSAIIPEAIEGHVEMILSIDTKGAVSQVEVIDAQPPDLFNNAARKAAYGTRIDPVTKNSDPAWVKTNYTIHFNEKNRMEYIQNSTTVKMRKLKFSSLKKALKKAGVAASINKKTYKSLRKQKLAFCQYSINKKRVKTIPYWYLETPSSIDVTSIFPDQEYFKGLRGAAIKQCPSHW